MRMALAKKVVWTLVASCALSFGVLSSGCAASGVGDPCVPEAIPLLGFTSRESYVETSSVQCRTRVCLVYRLQGHPERIVGTASCPSSDPTLAGTCVTEELREDRVFCSCRCSAAGDDTNLPLCQCNEGFHCVDLLTQGGAGVRGGYCIRSEFCEDNEDCPAGQRCLGNTCTTG
ncbi:MAG: hypothetical protein OHK0013_35210 [Sandaracinaceae bacterium]